MAKTGMPGAGMELGVEEGDGETRYTAGGCLRGIFMAVVVPTGIGAIAYFAAEAFLWRQLAGELLLERGWTSVGALWCLGCVILLLGGRTGGPTGAV